MAGTTNLLPFNPNQTNQETDATYLEDSNRSGGFGTDAIWPSVLANKTLNLLSNYLFALFTAFAQKGFTTNDDNVPLLIAQCANFLTSADILPAIMALAFSPTPAFNFGASNAYQMTLTGNITASTAKGLTPGQLVAFYFLQDSVGGRTVSYPGGFFSTVQPDPAPGALSVILFRVDVSGAVRAAAPLISNTGAFFSGNVAIPQSLNVSSLTTTGSFRIAGTQLQGDILVNNGTSFIPRAVTVADQTASRSFGTTFVNASGAEMRISGYATVAGSSDGTLTGFIGPTSASIEVWANDNTASLSNGKAMFGTMIVPAGYSYMIASFGDVTGIGKWIEYTYA
jgi:hypothetical protein